MSRVERAAPRAVPQPPDLRDAFTRAPAALAVTTLAGTITAANPALADLLGRDAATLIGTIFLESPTPTTPPMPCAATHLPRPTDGRSGANGGSTAATAG